MNAKEKFQQIRNCKYSKDIKYDPLIQKYLKETINQVELNREQFDFENLNEAKKFDGTSGVYLIYLIENERVKFTYIGETTNIYRRWRQHANNIPMSTDSLYKKIRRKIGVNKELIYQIKFVLLESDPDLVDENKRLYRETYNIYKYKTRFYSLNKKNCSRRLKCPDGHGLCKTWISYAETPDGKPKILVFGKSINKNCKTTFLIR